MESRSRSRGGERSASRIDPADQEQLRQHPVSLQRIAALFRPHRATIALVAALITASSVITIAQPFLVRAVIDDALPNRNLPLLAWLTGAMVLIAAVTAIIGVLQTWMSTQMGQRVMHGLRTELFTHLQSQSLSFFTRTRSGEVQSRLMNDIAGMQQVVTTTATGVAANVTTVVATFAAMVALSPSLTVISLQHCHQPSGLPARWLCCVVDSPNSASRRWQPCTPRSRRD